MSKSKAKTNSSGGMKAKVMDAMEAAGDKAQTVYADVKQAASSAADAVVKQAKVVRKKAEAAAKTVRTEATAAAKTVRKKARAAAKTVRKAVDDKVVKPVTKSVADARKRIAGAKKKTIAKKKPAAKKPAAKKSAAKKPAAKKAAAKKAPAKKAVKKAAKKAPAKKK